MITPLEHAVYLNHIQSTWSKNHEVWHPAHEIYAWKNFLLEEHNLVVRTMACGTECLVFRTPEARAKFYLAAEHYRTWSALTT